MIRLQVLGSVELRGSENQEILSVLSQPKRTALLTFLAVANPKGFHRRDKLLGLFWPDLDQDRGRAALRKALHHLRRSLGEEIVLRRGDEEVGLNWDGFRSDVAELEGAIQDGQSAQAFEAFSGDLLEGFFLPGCPEFERWLEIERDSLRTTVARAGWDAAHEMVTSGRVTEGERTAHRALALVPTNETEVRGFLTTLAAAGDRPAAVRFFQKFAALLREAIDLDPSEETQALLASIRTHTSPSGSEGHRFRPRPPEFGGPSPPEVPRPFTLPVGSERGTRGALPEPRVPVSEKRATHIVEWGAAFIAGGWALIALISVLDARFTWPVRLRPTLNIVVAFSSLLALVLAWYHGKTASRKISGPELLLVALLLVVLGIALSLIPG